MTLSTGKMRGGLAPDVRAGFWSGMRAGLLALVVAAPVWAQGTLAPGDFAALAEGHTLHFTLDGAPFGAEQYFEGQRSLWRFEDGRCEAGVWWADGNRICFRYGERLPAQCWRFRRNGDGVAAVLVEDGAETGLVLRMSRRDEAAGLPRTGRRELSATAFSGARCRSGCMRPG